MGSKPVRDMSEQELRREVLKLRRDGKEFVGHVRGFVALLDAEMKKPSSVTRGSAIAKLTNALVFGVNSFSYFTLGQPLLAPKAGGEDAEV